MAANLSGVYHIGLTNDDTELTLNVFFAGGPIDVHWTDGGQDKSQTFVADPFFRSADNYNVEGTVVLPVQGAPDRRRVISVSFANASPNAAQYVIEVVSPKRIPTGTSVPSGTPSPARLISEQGKLDPKANALFVVCVEH